MTLGSAIAQGATSYYKSALSEEGQTRRAQLRSQKADAEQALKATETLGDTKLEVESQELDNLKLANRQANAKLVQQQTFNAFDRYDGDDDVRHLNNLFTDLKANPQAQNLFGEIIRVDKMTDGDKQLIARDMGAQEAAAYDDSPELQKDLVKVTKKDGSVKIASLSQLAAMTGYTRYADSRTLERMKTLAQIRRLSATGMRTAKERQARLIVEEAGLDPESAEGKAMFLDELVKLNAKAPSEGTKAEREAERETRLQGFEKGDEGYEEALQANYEVIVERDRATAKQKDLSKSDEAREAIDELAGGEGKFLEEDLATPRLRRKYEPYIERMERLNPNLELDAATKKDLSYVNELVAIGKPGSEISSSETGLIDRLFIDTKKYLSDDVSGLDTASSYAAFRNTVRHALFGSVLTEGEIKSFNEQFGSLKQQAGPVVAQFRTALEQVRAKLETLVATNNSYVMKFRAGSSQEELNRMIDAIDERIAAFDGFIESDTTPPGKTATPEGKAALDAILFGTE